MKQSIRYIDEHEIREKKILLRVDFNVSFNMQHKIANDERIRQTIPTIEHLLKNNNMLILLSHLGRPQGRDENFSLKTVARDLQSYLPHTRVVLVPDLAQLQKLLSGNIDNKHLFLLENIRFFTGEDENDQVFSKQLQKHLKNAQRRDWQNQQTKRGMMSCIYNGKPSSRKN